MKKNLNVIEATEVEAQGVPEVEQSQEAAQATTEKNIEDMDFDEILALEPANTKGNVYNTYDEAKEKLIQEGVKQLTKSETNEGINPMILCMIKFWNDRAKLKVVMTKIKAEALRQGQDPDIFIQNLRNCLRSNDEIDAAISTGKYALNYFKPRKNQAPKGKMVLINVGGVTKSINEYKLAAIKNTPNLTKDEMRAKILEACTENTIADDLIF